MVMCHLSAKRFAHTSTTELDIRGRLGIIFWLIESNILEDIPVKIFLVNEQRQYSIEGHISLRN